MGSARILIVSIFVLATLPFQAFAQVDAPVANGASRPTTSAGPCPVESAPADNFGGTSDDKRRTTSKDPCAVADDNLARDEAEILRSKTPEAIVASQIWDHKSRPRFLDAIQRRFELRPAEVTKIDKAGFAVLARLQVATYAHGYHEIFQSQLPLYVTADSLFHAIFASHDSVVARLEGASMAPKLARALDDMHCALVAAAGDYPPEVARDLDLYLLVARKLIASGAPPHGASEEVERDAEALVAKANAANELATVELFGRSRLVDFTQYGPRGHYANDESMQRYFRAATWASRLEFNLVSRSSRSSAPGLTPDPSETPREAIAALALADLAARSGADKAIAELDAAWSALAGRREDISVAQLHQFRAVVGSLKDPGAFGKLKDAIGDRFRRTTRLHPMPEGSSELPAIATLIGPRIVADAGALLPLVNSAVPGRQRLGMADVAFTLGFDPAKSYLFKDLSSFPTLGGQLDTARKQLSGAPIGDDLYSAWLSAIRGLARSPEGVLPSFMAGDAGKDLRLNSIAAAYGQLKHANVLVAGEPYAEFGCEIPDAYVEPAPAAYDGLIEYAARGAKLATLLDPSGQAGVRVHFERVGQVLRVLRAIVDDELAGRPLTAAQRRWLGMVSELDLDRGVEMTGYPPMYSGWYFDLLYARQEDGMRGADFIADYFTSQEGVAYVGASAPRLGIFVIDVGGGPARAFVGPVARAYEVQGPLAERYTDESARALKARDDPWSKSYSIDAPRSPSSLQLNYDAPARRLVLTSDEALGFATIKALDHHRAPIETLRVKVKQGETRIQIKASRVSGFSLQLGDFQGFAIGDAYGDIRGQWGKPPAAP